MILFSFYLKVFSQNIKLNNTARRQLLYYVLYTVLEIIRINVGI